MVRAVVALALCIVLSGAIASCSGGAADRRFQGTYGGISGGTGR